VIRESDERMCAGREFQLLGGDTQKVSVCSVHSCKQTKLFTFSWESCYHLSDIWHCMCYTVLF